MMMPLALSLFLSLLLPSAVPVPEQRQNKKKENKLPLLLENDLMSLGLPLEDYTRLEALGHLSDGDALLHLLPTAHCISATTIQSANALLIIIYHCQSIEPTTTTKKMLLSSSGAPFI
jgi:hypothetical protein